MRDDHFKGFAEDRGGAKRVRFWTSLLDDLIVRQSSDCPWRDEPRGSCGARFCDLPPRRPRGR
jgi:hypothetical protein